LLLAVHRGASKKRFIRQKRALRTDARKGRNKIAQGIALGDGIFDDFKL
jgi:hypothetical protein